MVGHPTSRLATTHRSWADSPLEGEMPGADHSLHLLCPQGRVLTRPGLGPWQELHFAPFSDGRGH